MANNLIIRTTYCQLQDGSLKSNLGDLVKTTILDSCLPEGYQWLTDSRGESILKWFLDKDRILNYESSSISLKDFDNIYNADNYVLSPELFLDFNGKWRGFILKEGGIIPENGYIDDTKTYKKTETGLSWQECLIRGMGFEWQEQDYLVPKINAPEQYDIGLNFDVHPEWKSKKWPMEYWKTLDNLLNKDFRVSYQQGLNNFDEYLKWLASCRIIVTCETFGLHLASALRKKTVAIVGALENREYHYNRTQLITPKQRECMPCNQKECAYGKSCLEEITPQQIKEIIIQNL